MGSVSRERRCRRFIEEFNISAVLVYDMTDFACVVKNGLNMNDQQLVYFYALLQHGERQEEVLIDVCIYDPEEEDYNAIMRTCDLLKLEEYEVVARMKKVDLIPKRYKLPV